MEQWLTSARTMKSYQQLPRCGGDQNPSPSFSSTLLDAIYRSIDETDATAAGRPSAPATALKRSSTVHHHYKPSPAPPVAERPVIRTTSSLRPPSTSSSSDNSSYGGFSSSEPESAAAHRNRILRPIRTAAAAVSLPRPAPAPAAESGGHRKEEKKKLTSIRRKLRDLAKSRTAAPPSPGSRLAGFINSLFTTGSPRKPKSSAVPAAASGDSSACSSASSYSRSCLNSKTTSASKMGRRAAGEKRSVRFDPVSVILDEECRAPAATSRKKRVEELLMGFGVEDENEEEWSESSESSSDLFELENLAVVGGYRDELPVYDSTRYDAISRHAGTFRL